MYVNSQDSCFPERLRKGCDSMGNAKTLAECLLSEKTGDDERAGDVVIVPVNSDRSPHLIFRLYVWPFELPGDFSYTKDSSLDAHRGRIGGAECIGALRDPIVECMPP